MSNPVRQAVTWAALSTALFFLYRIWQELRREGNETIIVLDQLGDDSQPAYSQWPEQPALLNGRGGLEKDPLAN